MGIFDEQIAFVDQFEIGLRSVLQDTIRQFDFVVKDYVVNKQLFQKGIDGDGERLPGYKRTTIRIKQRKGQPVDRTTLHDTEKFVESITIDAFDDRFEIESSVSYDKYIVKRYGRNVLKVSDENFGEFLNIYFLPNLKTRYGFN
jgi:hypothetical protein